MFIYRSVRAKIAQIGLFKTKIETFLGSKLEIGNTYCSGTICVICTPFCMSPKSFSFYFSCCRQYRHLNCNCCNIKAYSFSLFYLPQLCCERQFVYHQSLSQIQYFIFANLNISKPDIFACCASSLNKMVEVSTIFRETQVQFGHFHLCFNLSFSKPVPKVRCQMQMVVILQGQFAKRMKDNITITWQLKVNLTLLTNVGTKDHLQLKLGRVGKYYWPK